MKLKTTITVKLSDATIAPDFSALGGTDNTYTPPSDDTPGKVNMTICSKNNFTIKTLSLDGVQIGVDFNGGPEWLSHNGVTMTKARTHPNTILFSLVESKIAQGQARTATVTLKTKAVVKIIHLQSYRHSKSRSWKKATRQENLSKIV